MVPDLAVRRRSRAPVALIGTLALVLAAASLVVGVVNITRTAGPSVATTKSGPAVASPAVVPAGSVALSLVPNVYGLSTADAAGALQAAGVTNSIDNLNCQSVANGHVIAQSPPSGSEVGIGTRVNLQIACTGM
jgi:hypothetical protein